MTKQEQDWYSVEKVPAFRPTFSSDPKDNVSSSFFDESDDDTDEYYSEDYGH